ncbi:wall-associated receptor kinase-like 2 [Silene latifolia]|uniref:wall-associated receptor kinase-like 2 n=1 Tax=Silene latifolia TaxID=37657 RepID=UPI003D7711E6
MEMRGLVGSSLFGMTVLFVFAMDAARSTAKMRRQTIEKAKNFKKKGGLLLEHQISSSDWMIERTRLFTQTELDKATEQFSEYRVLRQGGQGAVYKGILADGNVVAIKKTKTVGKNHVATFINEVVLLSQVNRMSIVKLLGCCLEMETA